MHQKNTMSRMTIDILSEDHRRLKALAALCNTSMRELVADWIHGNLHSDDMPNAETLKAIVDIDKGKNLVKAKDAIELFKKLEI